MSLSRPVDSESGPSLYWAAALILTAAIRLYLFANYHTINPDGVLYIEAARHFWEGNWVAGLASFYSPLFPLMIATVFPIVGDWESAGQLGPFLLGLLILLPLFGLLRRTHGSRVAYAALFFYGVSPYLARLAVEVRTEIPYVFFLILSLYLLQRGLEDGGWLTFFLSGVCSALAYLIRPEGVVLVPISVFFLFFRRWVTDRVERVWLKSSAVALGFVLFSAPYIFYLKWDTGEWLLSRKTGFQVSVGLAEHDVEAAQEQVRLKKSDRISVVDLISARPLVYAKKVVIDAFRAFVFYLEALHYSYLPFLFLGWFFFFRGRFWAKDEFLFVMTVLFYLAILSLVYVSRRYEIALAAVSLGWVAAGYLALVDHIHSRWNSRGAQLITALAIVSFAAGTLPKTLQPIGLDKSYLREAGTYLKQRPGNPTIFTTNGRVAFYASGQNRIRHVQRDGSLFSSDVQDVDYIALGHGAVRRFEKSLRDYGWYLDKEFSSPEDTDKLLVFCRQGIQQN